MRQHTATCVLLGTQLPDVDGLEVCRLIKNDPQSARTSVLLTSPGASDSHRRAQALNGGADSFLIEPVEPEELVSSINALLRMRGPRTPSAAPRRRCTRTRTCSASWRRRWPMWSGFSTPPPGASCSSARRSNRLGPLGPGGAARPAPVARMGAARGTLAHGSRMAEHAARRPARHRIPARTPQRRNPRSPYARFSVVRGARWPAARAWPASART